MKKILSLLLALVMLCVSLAALAEESEKITLKLNTARVKVYDADDSYLKGLTKSEDGLKTIVLLVKRSVQLQVEVSPKTVRNKRVTLSVDNDKVVRVSGNSLTGLKKGETVLTIASAEDPKVKLKYRLIVIQPITRITLTASEKSVAKGETIQLTPDFLPKDATRKQVTWSSANKDIATVNKNGVVTGKKRGTVRITATAEDGSNIRASLGIQVTQKAEKITLDKKEVTIDVGRSAALRATVLPKDTNNKRVVWSTSDKRVATVNAQGRITAVALGDCEIICTSQEVGTVLAKAKVHVQQPVKKVTFGEAPVVYNGESAKLKWTIDPANASNPKLAFTSSNERVLTVSKNGTVTGVSGGDAFVTAVTTDGSRRQARIKVSVLQHLTGVHMLRRVAYIDYGQTSGAGAVLEPEGARNLNGRMTWESANPSVATVKQNAGKPNKVDITGVGYGDTEVYGTTEDGGFRTSILVKVGNWENSLKLQKGDFDARGNLRFIVKNVSDLRITSITLEMECFDFDGKPQAVNTRNGSNVVKAVYNRALAPGQSTPESGWTLIDYDRMGVNEHGLAAIRVRITEFQINNDWVKLVRRNNRQAQITYNPHHVLR